MRNVEENIGMGDKKSNTKGVSPQRFKGGARRWYGAARGLAIILPFGLVLLPFMIMVSAYLPLAIVIGASLVGLAVPGRPHVGKSAWRTARESMVWILAALNIVVVGACFYFTTGFFGIALNSGFESAVKDADRIVVRDGGGRWSSNPEKDHVLFEITNKAEIATFNEMFRFCERELLQCKCSGYPGIDWWRDGQRIAVAGIHHRRKLRVTGISGDLCFTGESGCRVQDWLETHCGLTQGDNSPRYRRCMMARAIIESEALGRAKANEGRKPTLDEIRDEFKKNGKEFPKCPAGGEYSLTFGEDGTPMVKCTVPRHD